MEESDFVSDLLPQLPGLLFLLVFRLGRGAGAASWFQWGGVILHDLDMLGDLMNFWVMAQLSERGHGRPNRIGPSL